MSAHCNKCGRVAHNGRTDCDGIINDLTAEEIRLETAAVETDARLRFPLAMVYLTLSADLRARRSA